MVTNKNISVDISSINYLEAPVKKGERIGTITVKNGEDVIEIVDICVSKEIKKRNIYDYLSIFAKCIVL